MSQCCQFRLCKPVRRPLPCTCRCPPSGLVDAALSFAVYKKQRTVPREVSIQYLSDLLLHATVHHLFQIGLVRWTQSSFLHMFQSFVSNHCEVAHFFLVRSFLLDVIIYSGSFLLLRPCTISSMWLSSSFTMMSGT